jgi:hypothetical protein
MNVFCKFFEFVLSLGFGCKVEMNVFCKFFEFVLSLGLGCKVELEPQWATQFLGVGVQILFKLLRI